MRTVAKELRTIAASMKRIEKALDRLMAAQAPHRAEAAAGTKGGHAGRRTLRLSPTRRAALKLQGQYMGYMRGLPPAQKRRVKALRITKGMGAAVLFARKLAAA
jgi:hypothetical protein